MHVIVSINIIVNVIVSIRIIVITWALALELVFALSLLELAYEIMLASVSTLALPFMYDKKMIMFSINIRISVASSTSIIMRVGV